MLHIYGYSTSIYTCNIYTITAMHIILLLTLNHFEFTPRQVHAGGQVVSLKMMLIPDVIEKINAYLPDQIRAWGFARVKNSFDAKDACSSRIYEYLLPTYCLDTNRNGRSTVDTNGAPSGLAGHQLHDNRIPKPSDQGTRLSFLLQITRISIQHILPYPIF